MPDAFVCANDTMAILVCDYLKNMGYKIPSDVVVTGFDGISDAGTYSPSITTVQSDFVDMGEKTFALLYKLMNGSSSAEDVCIIPKLIPQESCGCLAYKHPDHNYIDSKYVARNVAADFHRSLVRTSVCFADIDDADSLFHSLLIQAEFFRFTKLYFCINSEITAENSVYFSRNAACRTVSEKVSVFYVNSSRELQKDVIDSKSLYPPHAQKGKYDGVLSFSPLYYRQFCLGYVICSPACGQNFSDYFLPWIMNVANIIGGFYTRKEFERMLPHD